MPASFSLLRRIPVVASLLTSLFLSGTATAQEKDPAQLRIAYQKGLSDWCWRNHTSYWKNVSRTQK